MQQGSKSYIVKPVRGFGLERVHIGCMRRVASNYKSNGNPLSDLCGDSMVFIGDESGYRQFCLSGR